MRAHTEKQWFAVIGKTFQGKRTYCGDHAGSTHVRPPHQTQRHVDLSDAGARSQFHGAADRGRACLIDLPMAQSLVCRDHYVRTIMFTRRREKENILDAVKYNT